MCTAVHCTVPSYESTFVRKYESTFESSVLSYEGTVLSYENRITYLRRQHSTYHYTYVYSVHYTTVRRYKVLSKVLSYESTHIQYSTFGSKFYESTKVLSNESIIQHNSYESTNIASFKLEKNSRDNSCRS